jgi:hypothetical protein
MAGMARIAFCTGKLISQAYMGFDPFASGNMTKVGKSDCEGTFAAMRRDDEDAPTADLSSTYVFPLLSRTPVARRLRCLRETPN